MPNYELQHKIITYKSENLFLSLHLSFCLCLCTGILDNRNYTSPKIIQPKKKENNKQTQIIVRVYARDAWTKGARHRLRNAFAQPQTELPLDRRQRWTDMRQINPDTQTQSQGVCAIRHCKGFPGVGSKLAEL